MSDQSDASVEYKQVNLIFIGRRKSREHKQAWMWVQIDPTKNDGSPLHYNPDDELWFNGKNLAKGVQPGVIIEINTKPSDKGGVSYLLGTSKIIGHWDNEEDVQRWAFAHRLAEREIDQASNAVKKVKEAIPMENLIPFKRAYHNCTNAAQRAQLIAMIIEEVTNKRL